MFDLKLAFAYAEASLSLSSLSLSCMYIYTHMLSHSSHGTPRDTAVHSQDTHGTPVFELLVHQTPRRMMSRSRNRSRSSSSSLWVTRTQRRTHDASRTTRTRTRNTIPRLDSTFTSRALNRADFHLYRLTHGRLWPSSARDLSISFP